MRRSLPVLAAAIVAATVLAGCSSSTQSQADATTTPAAASTACAPAASGTASDGVTLSGAKGTDPKATFTTPLSVTSTERTVATAGTGDIVPNGASATVEFALYDGATGKELTTTGFDGTNAQKIVVDSTYLAGLVKTIACSTVGSRVVGVIPPAEMFGTTGNESLGVAATDSIVFIVDIDSIVQPVKAEDYKTMTGMPGVTFDSTGKPTITIPKSDPPATTRLGLITEGTGAVVPAGATVTVNYTGVLWRTGKVFDSSWERGTPAQFATSGVVDGFRIALEGQKVGSTLISVVAPADGYGSAGQGETILGTDTMVFVVNIVSIDG